MRDNYDGVYTRWLKDPENFWAEAAEAVHWHKEEREPVGVTFVPTATPSTCWFSWMPQRSLAASSCHG
jgi:hypothetical protein